MPSKWKVVPQCSKKSIREHSNANIFQNVFVNKLHTTLIVSFLRAYNVLSRRHRCPILPEQFKYIHLLIFILADIMSPKQDDISLAMHIMLREILYLTSYKNGCRPKSAWVPTLSLIENTKWCQNCDVSVSSTILKYIASKCEVVHSVRITSAKSLSTFKFS